jgi:hypothetical protein
MHQLEVVKLRCKRELDDDGGLAGAFSDAGVKILLKNNLRLRKVTLKRFPLTDRSLEYFMEFFDSREMPAEGLKAAIAERNKRLELKTSHANGFSGESVEKLIAAIERSKNCSQHWSVKIKALITHG